MGRRKLNLVLEHLSKANLDLPKLPSGWIWVASEEIANHVSGVAFKSTDFIKEGRKKPKDHSKNKKLTHTSV